MELKKGPGHLVYVSPNDPGIIRKRCGKGFIYLDEGKRKIENEKILDRIKSLVIPPMWERVWICPDENGYLQSIGIDSKNRRQYIYHPDWLAHQQQSKFEKLFDFGKSLPSIRTRIKKDLTLKGWPKLKVLALTVDLMDHYFFRIGNEQYAKQNQSYGVTTLRKKHIKKVNGNSLAISFKAKSGIHRTVNIYHKRTTTMIREISELPGYEVFRYVDEGGESQKINSGDVNAYIKEVSGGEFTAKDFRTWGGSKLVLQTYPDAMEAAQVNPKLKLETQLIKSVAKMLGNTVSVYRSYYVHPQVLRAVLTYTLEEYRKKLEATEKLKRWPQLDSHEKLLMKILSG